MKNYTVTVSDPSVKYDRPGVIEVYARNAKDAISLARREMSNRGYDRHDGPFKYTAQVAA